MKDLYSRRDALRGFALLAAAGGCAVRAFSEAHAAEPVHLSPTDPTAVALAYHESAKSIAAKDFPSFQPGQSCATCLQLQGAAGQPWRACNIFPGKLVSADGWCKVWVKKV